MKLNEDQLKQILLDSGFVSEEDFQLALKSSKEMGSDVTDILIFRGVISEQALGQLVAEYLKVPFVSVGAQVIPMEILELVPEKMARAHKMVPFALSKKVLSMAMNDPNDFEAQEFLRRHSGAKIKPFYSTPEDIRRALGQYKRNIKTDFDEIISENIKLAGEAPKDIAKKAEELPIIKILNTILEYAISEGTSDIHLEKLTNEVNFICLTESR